MIDMSVQEAYQGMIMQRVDAVDRKVMERKEYKEREMAMSEIESLCHSLGKDECFERLNEKLQKFEYLIASNCYALGIRDRMQMENMEIV
ncbi:MAG: hypothetical protein J5908_07550 [Selenomonas sp.]|jgi:hypothetical protein|nr:hypothetical protein [Selenomonas sp.]